jgi:hypothetical protein
VSLAQRRPLLDRVRERLHLLGVDAAERQLHADHLHVGLALAVDPLLEAEADELVLEDVAPHELRRLGVEVVELALEDRDHVPGDVLVHLRVLQRADLALAAVALLAVHVEFVLGSDPVEGGAGAVRAGAVAAVFGRLAGAVRAGRGGPGSLVRGRAFHAWSVLHKS